MKLQCSVMHEPSPQLCYMKLKTSEAAGAVPFARYQQFTELAVIILETLPPDLETLKSIRRPFLIAGGGSRGISLVLHISFLFGLANDSTAVMRPLLQHILALN